LQKITFLESQKKILLEHTENEKPNEACAILFGINNDENLIVKEIFLAENIEKSPTRFTISNEQLMEIYKVAEEREMDMVGIFHSHPNSAAYPSDTDKKFMHSNPVVWVIYSGISREFKSYLLHRDAIEISTEFL